MASPQFINAVSIRNVMKVFWLTVGALIGIHVVLMVVHFELHKVPWYVRQLFDVDEEDSFPTWYSAFALAVTAFVLWFNARGHRAIASPWRWHWYGLSIGFLLLSVDEIAGVHETLNSVLPMHWTLPGAILVTLIGLCYLKFLAHLERRIALQFILGGAVFVGGAIGVEWFSEPYLADKELNTLAYNLWTAVEEGMEMSGVLIFLRALLISMKADAPVLQMRVDLTE